MSRAFSISGVVLGLVFLCGCAAKAPELSSFKAHDFPVYTPSTVESAMGAQTGEDLNDPKASHHLTYWLHSESKPEVIAQWYKDKMKTLPSATEIAGEDKTEGSLFQLRTGPLSQSDKIESYSVLVEKELDNGKSVLRITETLKPGLKYE